MEQQLVKLTLRDRNNFTKTIHTTITDRYYDYIHVPQKQLSFFLGNPQLAPDMPFRKVVRFRFVMKAWTDEYLYQECVLQ